MFNAIGFSQTDIGIEIAHLLLLAFNKLDEWDD